MERVKHENLRQAIVAVMEEVPYLLKEQRQGLDYKALMEGEVIGNIHPAFVKHGVLVHPAPGGKLEHIGTLEIGQYKKIWNHVILSRRFVIRHADSDESIEIEGWGEAMNPGDKAIGAAQTYALKYALRQAFLIESGDDPDKKSAASMERRKQIKLDATAEKAVNAMRSSTAKKADLLRYRQAYLSRGFDAETIEHLEGVFWTQFPLAYGEEQPPDVTKAPAIPTARIQDADKLVAKAGGSL